MTVAESPAPHPLFTEPDHPVLVSADGVMLGKSALVSVGTDNRFETVTAMMPDRGWKGRDAHGHEHRAEVVGQRVTYPTLESFVKEICFNCDVEPHDVPALRCRVCLDLVNPSSSYQSRRYLADRWGTVILQGPATLLMAAKGRPFALRLDSEVHEGAWLEAPRAMPQAAETSMGTGHMVKLRLLSGVDGAPFVLGQKAVAV